MQHTKNILNKVHSVVICNEMGIADAFKYGKDIFLDNRLNYLSLIYIIPAISPPPLFSRELNIFEKTFPENFHVYRIQSNAVTFRIVQVIQNFVEPIINANLLPKMDFSIFGEKEFTEYILDSLYFLGVKSSSIRIITI